MTTIAIFTALYPPAVKGGGPIRSTEVLTETASLEMAPIVITNDHDLGEQKAMAVTANVWTQRGRARIRYTTASSIVELVRGYSAVKREHPSLLNFNSFFSAKFTIFPLLLWRLGYWGKPILLLAPRGEFGDGALRRRSLKKRLYMGLFRLLGIHRSVIWHSTADHETEGIRRAWGADATIILREEGTLLPLEPRVPLRNLQEVSRFVFLGRIVEHKGLDVVLQALAGMTAPVSLDIYGPEEDASYAARCREYAAALPDNVAVAFRGVVAPDQVRETLAAYDAFLMPTAGENFGHVIAESLSVSCPVFTTSHTPWTTTLKTGGGIVVNNREPANWLLVIDRFVALPLEKRAELRTEAGNAYRYWRAQPEKPHVWNLALKMGKN